MHIHVYGYFVSKVSLLYCSKICSKKMHFSVTLDLVADKLKQSVHNLYYRFIFTGALMVLLCLDLAIASLLSVLLQVFLSGCILQLFFILHTLNFWRVRLQVCLHLSVCHIVSCSYFVTSGFLTKSCNNHW